MTDDDKLADFFAHRLYDAVSTAVALVKARGLSEHEAYVIITKSVEMILNHLEAAKAVKTWTD